MFRAFSAGPSYARLGLLVVIVVFGLPLLLGLGRWDMENDEAIYSYTVERILETGEWVTPRSIWGDLPFFEKPPLKFWMVAGVMRAGLAPAGDAGMRLVDALFGIVAFVYVYLLGVRLAGPLSGVLSVLVLFAFSPLVFEHGLRSNNMEASLVLAYCGGVFHFVRWAESGQVRARRREAVIVGLYFVLGFMTKFVAVLFLPMMLGVSLLVRPAGVAMLRQRWSDWVIPLLASVLLVAPWFVYQTLQPAGGREFWRVLVGEHVYRRLAGVLIPEHLAPWHYYVTSTWREIGFAQARLVIVAGLVWLVYAAWRQRNWLARVVLVWLVLPYAAMSLGTSKLLHYTYPFLAPIALAGGAASALALQAARGEAGARLAARIRASLPAVSAWAQGAHAQGLLVAAGIVALGLGVWTAIGGPVIIEAHDVRIFRNGSIVRPLAVAALCLGLTRWGRRLGLGAAVAALLLVLPTERYFESLRRAMSVNHPLRTVRDCAVDVQRTTGARAPGVLRASGNVLHHSYYFYMRHAGAWIIADPPSEKPALASALGHVEPRPVLVTTAQYMDLVRAGHAAPPGVRLEENVAVLLPGAFEVCVPLALAAGARPLDPARALASAQ
jgi:4-amino-4-deoxy-L-arabinose transferase-like glycosyltransferase